VTTPAARGVHADPHDARFRHGKDDAFRDWWEARKYSPKASDFAYLRGYDFGWEMASDPLHEDGRDPQMSLEL
jgi:hypothetical protein